MVNSPHVPSGNFHELRSGFSQDSSKGRLRAVVPEPSAVQEEPFRAGDAANADLIGPRKLIRPRLPAGTSRARALGPRNDSPMLSHQTTMLVAHEEHAGSHSEAFYFQKQVQTQTMMVFVLEDGEQVEGYIEWYDRDVIKIRNGSRTLIYKSAIKYLYKAGDIHCALDGFKRVR